MGDIYLPVIIRENPIATGVQDYHEVIDIPQNWRHRTTASIGFDTAKFGIIGSQGYMEEWLFNGLGREITRYDGENVIWEGMVWWIEMALPNLTIRISLENIANRVWVIYAPADTTSTVPKIGDQTRTAKQIDAVSQALYGVIDKPLNGGTCSATEAAQRRDAYLEAFKFPRYQQFPGRRGRTLLTIGCRGFGHTLGMQRYNQTAAGGTDARSTIVAAIIAAKAQYIASSQIDTNAMTVQKYYNDDRTSLDLLQNIASQGDSSGNRWLASVEEDRKFFYQIVSTEIRYRRRASDPGMPIHDTLTGELAKEWLVRPNAWIRTLDIYPYISDDPATRGSFETDMQVEFIEEVIWSEKSGLTLNSSKFGRIDVLIAQLAEKGQKLI